MRGRTHGDARSSAPLRVGSIVTLLALPSGGCGENAGAGAAAVRDSAGIVIVEHGRIDREGIPSWTLADSPSVRIGSVDGPEETIFHDVRDVRRLRSGSILVLDGSMRLRTFDSTGAPLWSAAGEGDGPGELRYAFLVRQMRGDSIAVWDPGVNRLNIFSPRGEFVRSATSRDLPGQGQATGRIDAEHLLVEVPRLERGRAAGREAFVWHRTYHAVDLEGTVSTDLGERVVGTEYREQGNAISAAIFDDYAVVAAVPDGIWFGSHPVSELHRIGDGGRVQRIVRWRTADRTVTEEDVEALVAVWSADAGDDENLRRIYARYGAEHPRADRFPAFEDVIVDRAGGLWVQEYVKEHEDDGRRRWTAFSPDGTEIIGRLTHSGRFEPYDIGDDWILGVERDELDVPSVCLYRIVRVS